MRYAWYVLGDYLGRHRWTPQAVELHLAAAADWLLRAQQATPDDGVAASYDLRRRQWNASYPETTGYIIPSLYDYARFAAAPRYAEQAQRMAQWESDIQLPDGGVRAGTMGAEPVVPTVFNTGQVLFGWARAWRETGEERLRESLVRAADWLVAAQDDDGAWRRFASPFASHKLNAYNTRSAFGLLRAHQATGNDTYLRAAVANVAWVAGQAASNGWLDHNCLDDNERPLTHTIAYSIRGIFEVALAAGEDAMVDLAVKMATAVAQAQRADGALPGRLDRDWRPAASWTCVTGNAQMALNWLRIAAETGQTQLRDHARRANQFNMSIQDLTTSDLDTRGAIKGSYPVNGGYMTHRYPNWAAKFFMDALMLEQGVAVDQ